MVQNLTPIKKFREFYECEFSHYSDSIFFYIDNPNDWDIDNDFTMPKNLTESEKNANNQSRNQSRNSRKQSRKTGKNDEYRTDRLARNLAKITE